RDRGDAVEPVLEGFCACFLRRGRIHARGVEGAELLVGGLRIRGRGGGEALDDGAQGGVIALDQLREAAVARVLGRERGAGQPAAVREPIEVLAGGAGGVEVGGVEAVVRGLGRGARGEHGYEQ